MFKIDFKKQVLPHLLVLIAFFAVLFIYFSPAFKGMEIVQSDILQWKGGAQELINFREKTGEQSLWSNSMFSGMPSYFVSTQYEGNLFHHVQSYIRLGFPTPSWHVLMFLISGYIGLVLMGVRPWLAALGAFAYAFSSFTFISLEAGHNGKVLAMAYLPWIVGAAYHAYRKNLWIGAALFGLGLALHLLTNHLQITYYLVLIMIGLGIAELVRAVKEKNYLPFIKNSVVLIVVALLAASTNMGAILTTMEYGQYSIRGKSELKSKGGEAVGSGLDRDYAFDWSNSKDETFTILVPNYYGGGSQGELSEKSATFKAIEAQAGRQTAKEAVKQMPMYFGQLAFTSGPIYFGAIICFLFVLGLIVVKNEYKYWLLAITILSFMLSWGKNFEAFNYFLFDYLPGYNKFRAVSMGIVMAQFCMPVLGILAVEQILSSKNIEEYKKPIITAAAITAGISFLIIIFAGMRSFDAKSDEMLMKQAGSWLVDAIHQDRESMVRGDAFRSILLILLTAGTLYVVALGKLKAEFAGAIVVVLIVFDLWSVDKRYLNDSNFKSKSQEAFFEITPADEMIKQDKALSYRVFNVQNPFNDARTSFFHKSIGGYSAAKLRRYQDVIEQHISQNNLSVLQMLNAKYILTGDERNPVQVLPGALGNAWFVKDVKYVHNPDEELNALGDTTFKPGETAIVDDSKFKVSQLNFSNEGATINLTDFKANQLTYASDNTQKGLAVFSEIYYPEGWKITLDGKPANMIRVNYLLRAMEIPAGQHKIVFAFHPDSFENGEKISLISSLILLIGTIAAIAFAIVSSKDKQKA